MVPQKKQLVTWPDGEQVIVFKGKKTMIFKVCENHLELEQIHGPAAERPDDAYIERCRKQLWKWYVFSQKKN